MNILNAILEQLSPQLLSQIGKSVGESPEATKSALGHAVPALLGSAAAQASSPQGATSLFNLLKDNAPQGGWQGSTVSSLLGNLFSGNSAGIGSSIIGALLGSKANLLRDFMATRSGIRSESASTLLGTGGQLLMGALGKQVGAGGLGAAGLGELLRSQLPHLQGMLSPDLANTLGLGKFISPLKTEAPAQAASSLLPPLARPNASSAARVLRLALIPLALLAAIFLVHRYHQRSNVGGTSDDTLATSGAGTSLVRQVEFNSSALADRLKMAIASGNGNPVDLQGLDFDSYGNLSGNSRNTISMVGRMVNENPGLKVTITTYGSSLEQAATKANAIRSGLVNAGIGGDRIAVQPEIGNTMTKLSFSK